MAACGSWLHHSVRLAAVADGRPPVLTVRSASPLATISSSAPSADIARVLSGAEERGMV